MRALIQFFVRQGVFAELITVGMVLLGIGALVLIQREAFPNISYDVISISTIYPGASADEVERLITSLLEQDLKEVDGIKKMESVSAEGRSYIIMQLDPDQTTEDEAKSDIQDVVDRFGGPEEAEDPIVTSLESNLKPVLVVSLAGNLSAMELREEAKKLEKIIESIGEVARVNFRGLRDLEIHVEADMQKMARYQISLMDIISSVSEQNKSIPGGSVDDFTTKNGQPTKEIIIRTVGDYKSAEDIGETVIRANDLAQSVKISDVAKVKLTLKKATELQHTDMQPSISLTVLKKEKADAIKLVDNVKNTINENLSQLKEGVKISYLDDMSFYIKRRLNVLSSNMSIGLALVLIILSIVLPFRVALVTSIGIPFAFLGTMLIFYSNDITLNLITMMGLIIVTGMLVDDAVVVTENAVRHLEEGKDPKTAAIDATAEIWQPVTASVLTTVAAFLPLMFMSGIFGKFISFIPMGVIIALLISLFECYFILPHHIGAFVKLKSKESREQAKGYFATLWDNVLVPGYLKILAWVLRFRYLVWALSLVLFVASLALAKFGMKFILFPPGGIESFMVNISAPIGTKIEETERLVIPLEEAVSQLPKSEMDNFSTSIGVRSIGPDDPNQKRGSEYAQIRVFLTPEDSRERSAKDIIDALKEKVKIPEGLIEVVFERVNPGPPVGKPISLGVQGEDYKEIMTVVDLLKEKISAIDGVTDISDSYSLGKEEVQVVVNKNEASAAQLNVSSIGTVVRSAYGGVAATKITSLEEEIDVVVKLTAEDQGDTKSLYNLKVPNRVGNLVPLSSVAQFTRTQGIASYEHSENRRQVKISGEVNEDITDANSVNAKIRLLLPEIKQKYPKINFSFGGEDQDTKESMESLMRAFIVALLGIAFILILVFQNLFQPLLVVGTIPLGIMSVIWTFYIHGMPISFMSMLGTIALGGVIVNNAIVLVSFVNENRKNGAGRQQSILNAGKTRLRPIFLTTLTTVAGLLPTAYGWGGLDPFVVPTALALGWGVLFGSVLTTMVFPAYLAIMDDIQYGFYKIKLKIFGAGSKP